MAAKPKIDYSLLDADWKSGIKSPEQMAREYSEKTGVTISRMAINKHYKDLNIPRDLKARIRARADAMVSASKVSGQVSPETKAKEKDIVEANAKMQADLILAHREQIGRGRSLLAKLMEELEAMTDNKELLEELGEIMIMDIEPGNSKESEKRAERMRQIFDAIMSTGGRLESVKKYAETLKILVALEREAFGIKDSSIDEDNVVVTRVELIAPK